MVLPQHWLNEEPGGRPGLDDRAFCYGDSLFETLRVTDARFHWLQLHLQRLQRGAMQLDIAYSEAAVTRHLELARDWLSCHASQDAIARLTLSRGEGARGYGADVDRPSVGIMLTQPSLRWGEYAEPASLVECDIRLPSQPRLAGIKHGSRLEQVLAAREVSAAGADEGLLLDDSGALVSAVSANLFAVIENNILTPPLSDRGVAGTVRELVLSSLTDEAGFTALEAPLQPADLVQASEVFLTNAVIGFRSVRSIPGASFSSTQVADTLRSLFLERSELTAE